MKLKGIKTTVLLLTVCFLSTSIGTLLGRKCIQQSNKYATNQNTVLLSKNEEKNKVLFFYKPSCPDCKKVITPIYLFNQMTHKVIFINLSNVGNYGYIGQFNLKSVPTLIYNNHRYAGTNIKRVINFLERK